MEGSHIRHEDGTLFKPDLITVIGESAIVSDVQVVWEVNLTLDHQHDNKRSKYEDDPKFQSSIRRLYPGKTIIFLKKLINKPQLYSPEPTVP